VSAVGSLSLGAITLTAPDDTRVWWDLLYDTE
jgi:hypothetical protein